MQTSYLRIKITVPLFVLDNRQNFSLITVKNNKIFIHFQNYFNETFNIFHH